MSNRRRSQSVSWCVLLGALFCSGHTPATEPPGDPKAARKTVSLRVPPYSPREETIFKALAKPVDMEFSETPLQDVVDYWKDRLKIEIQLDGRSLDDVGLDADTPITFRSKGLSFRSVLRLTLRQPDLTWVVRDDVLLITTPETAEDWEEVRFYEVSDLVLPSALPDGSDPNGQADFDSLIDLIPWVIRPTTWPEGTGPGPVIPFILPRSNLLVFSQTADVHEEVEHLLTALREVKRLGDPAKAAAMSTSLRAPPESAAEKAIRKALRQPLKIAVTETPLGGVLDLFRKQMKVEIQLDRRALDDVGRGGAGTPITRNLQGVSTRSALRLILRELDLTWVVEDKVLLITTPEQANRRLQTRVYPVGDLVRRADGAIDYEPLIGVHTPCVQPDTWNSAGGPGSVCEFTAPGIQVLVVSQTHEIHGQIEELLIALREVKRLGNPATVSSSLGAPPESAATKAVRAALRRPVKIEVIGMPLQDVVDLLKRQMKIEIHLDKRALNDVGIGTDTPITRNLQGISARSLLRLMLRELDLTWAVRGEVLLITTPEQAEYCLWTRVYPIGDLLGANRPRRPGQSDANDLCDIVQCSVRPPGWGESGPGSVAPFSGFGADCLVVTHVDSIHREVGALLAELRKIHHKRTGRAVKPERPTVDDAIRKVLRKPVEMNFSETPLQDVVDFLKDLLEIEIQLDRRALDDVGLGTDTPVTISVKGISGRAAVNLVLRPLDLTWIIQDEVLLFTTPEEAESRCQTTVHDVTDLVPVDKAKGNVKGTGAEHPRGPDGAFTPLLRPVGLSGHVQFGAVSIFRGPNFNAVILTQPQDVREEFEDLLKQLRRVAKAK